MKHIIPVEPYNVGRSSEASYNLGHFVSPATLLVEGACSAGGPGGWFVGGWDATGEGRTEYQGPMVPGPVAYIGGRAAVIDCNGGTGRLHREAEDQNLMFRVKAGDTVVLSDIEFTLTVDRRGYPHLSPC